MKADPGRKASIEPVAFTLTLAEALLGVDDEAEIVERILRALATHLSVGHAALVRIDRTGKNAEVAREWMDGSIASGAGVHRLNDFGRDLIADLRGGRTVAIGDVSKDARTAGTAGSRAAFRRLGIAACLDVPLISQGQLLGVLVVNCAMPRVWGPAAIRVAEHAAGRILAAMRRRRWTVDR